MPLCLDDHSWQTVGLCSQNFLLLEHRTFASFRFGCNGTHRQTTGPLLRALTQLISADRLHGLVEFGADPFILRKQIFLGFGVIAKRRHQQTAGPPPSILSQLTNVDRLMSSS